MTEKTATIVVPKDEIDVATRLSAILAGTDPRVVDGHLIVQVPLERLESALLLEPPDRKTGKRRMKMV